VLLDGVELREYRLQNLRSQIALVSQDVVLFNDTLAGNIAYGALAGASRAATTGPCRHVSKFAERRPHGSMQVRENGTLLSEGKGSVWLCAHCQGCADPDSRRGDFGAGQ
jgi:subfamily B ATP-binding cassette protein MsbA